MDNFANSEVQAELIRRHQSTLRVVLILIGTTVTLSVVAFALRGFLVPKPDPVVDGAWKIAILILGFGSIAFRRTMFSTMRLRDVGGVSGAKGLLNTLANTTIKVALIGDAIAVSGFVATILTGSDLYTYAAGLIAIFILLYCLPTRSSWERAVYQFAPYSTPGDPADRWGASPPI